MATIVPAILEKDKQSFESKVFAVTRIPGVERIQVDFCDGEFVQNTTTSIADIDPLNPAYIWEAHLMEKAPDSFLDYRIAGFKTIIVHYEAYQNAVALEQAIDTIISHGFTPAIAVNPETSLEGLVHYTPKVNQFTILSVQPGEQGRSFIEETFERVKQLRNLIPNAIIEVDGGVSLENARKLSEAGADFLVAGSHLLKSDNLSETYIQFVQEANLQA